MIYRNSRKIHFRVKDRAAVDVLDVYIRVLRYVRRASRSVRYIHKRGLLALPFNSKGRCEKPLYEERQRYGSYAFLVYLILCRREPGLFNSMKKLLWLLAWSFALIVSGCSSDDPDPDGGDVIKPDQEVPDPTGTILLSMRNDDGTSLNGLYIGKDDNFHGDGWIIASIGPVKGLGNVASIPLAGWAGKVSVTPGYGYVAYNTYSDEYYRIFVTDYMASATTGGVIGADIKYQKPFKGLDEAISLKQDKVVLPAEGGSEQLVFGNSSIVPFKVTSSEEWCRVQKASTRDFGFLYDAVVVSCDETYSAEEAKATVTIETLFGKTKEIEVTRAARGEFITLSQDKYDLGFNSNQAQFSINVFTNVEPSDIQVTSSDEWLSGVFSGRNYQSVRQIRWIEGQAASRATLENPISKDFIITAEGYVGADEREGTLTLSYGNVKSVLRVVQQGSGFKLSKYDFNFKAEEDLTQTVTWSGNLHYRSLCVDREDVNWFSAVFDYDRMTLTVQPNPFEESRSAIIKICYMGDGTWDGRTVIAEIEVTQEGAVPYDRYVYFESPASNYTVSFPITEGAKITSSADWCTATPNGSTLVIRATATTENRWAEISVEGVSSKIYVSQSKYKVGDTYSEGAVSGTVYSMENGIGKITRKLDGTYAWSTENVDIQGATDYNDGTKNMAAIKAIPGWKDLYPAFAAVETLNVDGATGWYLPAYNEYRFNQGATYQSEQPWSSTQNNAESAWYFRRWADSPSVDGKNGEHIIVAMNRFSYDFVKK